MIEELNYAKGTRVRVLKDNGTRGLVGLEGVVIQSLPGTVIVELEGDPANRFRVTTPYSMGSFHGPLRKARRCFRVTEVERA